MASLSAPYSAATFGRGDRPRSRYARHRNFMICLLFGSPGTSAALPQRPGRVRTIHEDEPRPGSVTAAPGRSHPRPALRPCGMDASRSDTRKNERDWLADQFQAHRAQLHALAYRTLGSLRDADDAIQETWLRLDRSDASAINDLRTWLSTVAGRVCLDMLRARKASREHYTGTWLPEPQLNAESADGPEQQAILADSVGMALLVVLESLSPAERLAFVLHDVFAVPFEQIAPMLHRTPHAPRQ